MDRDLLWPKLDALRVCLIAALADRPTCRVSVEPGGQPAWDVCCDCPDGGEGQAWVAVQTVIPVDPFPNQDVSPQRCHPLEYAAQIQVGVLRCAAVVDDQGVPPTSAELNEDAEKVSNDRQRVLEALLCCFASDDDPGEFQLGDWLALGPEGGCVGGRWAATIAVPSCACP